MCVISALTLVAFIGTVPRADTIDVRRANDEALYFLGSVDKFRLVTNSSGSALTPRSP
jgi:hypothetical protein